MIEIRPVNALAIDVGELVAELDAYQLSIYPAESNHLDAVVELDQQNVFFVGAYNGNELIGIGAIKYLNDDQPYAEIKRVYVRESGRGQGLSKRIMGQLEKDAIDRNVKVIRLETGIHQPEAIGLYEKFGYYKRDSFGEYLDDPLSVFMEKTWT
jgi:putative acetyltransferase